MIKCKHCHHTWSILPDDKYPFFCHKCGWDLQSNTYIPMKYKDYYKHLYEGYPWGTYDYTKRDAETQPNGGSLPSEEPNDLGMRTSRVSDMIEANRPTNPKKWAAAKSAARSKFKVYPSAYANLWAAKKYKSMGGGWKKGKKK